jgi:hypothetical protein
MKVTSEITIAELMKRFPNGFSVGPGTPENPGALSRIIFASSHLRAVASNHPIVEGNQGYLVVDMDEE